KAKGTRQKEKGNWPSYFSLLPCSFCLVRDTLQGKSTGCPSLRTPSLMYVAWSIVWEMNRTEPSPKAKLAPPEWFVLKPLLICQFQTLWRPSGLQSSFG